MVENRRQNIILALFLLVAIIPVNSLTLGWEINSLSRGGSRGGGVFRIDIFPRCLLLGRIIAWDFEIYFWL